MAVSGSGSEGTCPHSYGLGHRDPLDDMPQPLESGARTEE